MNTEYNAVFDIDFYFRHELSYDSNNLFPHQHLDYEVFLNLSDELLVYINGVTRIVKKGTILLFNNMDLHRTQKLSPDIYDRYVFHFKPDYITSLSSPQTDLLACFLYRPFENSHYLPLTDTQLTQVVKKLEAVIRLEKENEEFVYGKDILLKTKLAELLIFVNDLYCKYHNIKHSELNFKYSQIYQIIDYINKNYTESCSLEHLTNHFKINKNYLCKLFREVSGKSITQYTLDCRLSYAKSYLLQGFQVDEVCSLSGFQNLSHFSRTFKSHEGISPKQFQLSNRK